jgi:hypothetical protein
MLPCIDLQRQGFIFNPLLVFTDWDLGFEGQGLGFLILDFGFWMLVLGFEVSGLGVAVWGLEFEALGSGVMVWGLGLRVNRGPWR